MPQSLDATRASSGTACAPMVVGVLCLGCRSSPRSAPLPSLRSALSSGPEAADQGLRLLASILDPNQARGVRGASSREERRCTPAGPGEAITHAAVDSMVWLSSSSGLKGAR
jgi:hypothetical protein